MLTKINETCKEYKIKINKNGKTKILICNKQALFFNIKILNEKSETIKLYTYIFVK